MAERRSNDLSFGQVGEVTYDVDESQWGFSLDTSSCPIFKQILPIAHNQQPHSQLPPQTKNTSLSTPRDRRRWLYEAQPELFPARSSISNLLQDAATTQFKSSEITGPLLALGGALVEGHGSRTNPVIAIPCGEGCNTLRLLRPITEKCGWGKKSSLTLNLMDASKGDVAYWVGTGGAIQQIIFAEKDGQDLISSYWLAVRQPSKITFFKPTCRLRPVPAHTPAGFRIFHPPSRLDPNPLAVLTTEQSGSSNYVDVSFNPYYVRQFAVIDEEGSWSTCNIEGRVGKKQKLLILPGKKGYISGQHVHDPLPKRLDHTDGWHRILWVSSVSTILACSRRQISLFDISGPPTKIHSPEIIPPSSTDWILDVKRSGMNPNFLFLLTSSRIFWLAVVASGEERSGESAGARIVLSHRHFRDPNDESMRISLMNDDYISVLITSSKSLFVNVFNFSMDGSAFPMAKQSSLILSTGTLNQTKKTTHLQDLLLLKSYTTLQKAQVQGPEYEYHQRDIRFYQAWSLSSDLELGSMLLYADGTQYNREADYFVTEPTNKVLVSRKGAKQERIGDSFIVPDGDLDEGAKSGLVPDYHYPAQTLRLRTQYKDNLKMRLNWQEIFQHMFYPSVDVSDMDSFMTDLLNNISEYVTQAKQNTSTPMCTLHDLSKSPMFSRDLETATLMLQGYLDDARLDDDVDSPSMLVLSDLTLRPSSELARQDTNSFPSFVEVYKVLEEQWIKSQPLASSGLTRLTRFNLARRISTELSLSSLALSIRSKEEVMQLPGTDAVMPTVEGDELYDEKPLASQSSRLTSQMMVQEGFGLPTPAQTPSLYSQHSSIISSHPKESPEILRLRKYAIEIEAPDELHKLSLLDRWPSTRGINPATYTWNATEEAELLDERGKKRRALKAKRVEALRKKHTEQFLDQAVDNSSGPVSQPARSNRFGSQPTVAQHATSSQTVVDLPMTQPGRGMFGSRKAEIGKQKVKKKRNAGFR